MEKIILNLQQKLSEAQTAIGTVAKERENPYFKSKYIDINALLEVVKPALAEFKLILLQPIKAESGKNVLHTIIKDLESKDEIESSIILPENPDPQKYGAIITYFRRYGIVSLLSIQAEDTDGNDTYTQPAHNNAYKAPTTPNNATAKVPTCSICKKPMKATKTGSKTPFYCKHGNDWGKPIYQDRPMTSNEEEFVRELEMDFGNMGQGLNN